MKNQAEKLKYITLGIVGAIALLVIWNFIEPRLLNIENETANIPNLPASESCFRSNRLIEQG